MKNVLGQSIVLLLCAVLAGCELLCQAGTGTCGMSSEEREKLLHPKTYGQYFSKTGMTIESWRQDWIACGGMSSGNYVAGSRFADETDDFAASDRKTDQLEKCMTEKGYTYSSARP